MIKYDLIQNKTNVKALLIFKKNEEEVIGKVHFKYTPSRVVVNLWNWGKNKEGKQTTFENDDIIQINHANGYGYDKETAALCGLCIDGIILNDHCGKDKRTEKILKDYHNDKITEQQARKKIRKIGASFANWNSNINKWNNLYLISGLEKLNALGYEIIKAI